ncbi:DUF6445 family protein [Asticcacaulis benevestitus]|uniref:Uncharacterized protein n=1 Tax=Asticcacaulis benevestitus DSM 16100 = ATCC BAA-896 TaxID=1121022 RepID=V4P0V7_9CAUL|nr:DUF6445 family protein [Asticcacaulis benevestitus]ESQ87607.1 hypothetical protein ABENE_17220 [Asticcacaulis benevestitus DSM 16100 = ATCC BAA-896]
MEVEVHEVGRSKSKVIVIDDFLTHAQDAVDAAAALPAFPPEGRTAYPGKRHQIGPGDKASSYVMDILKGAGPLIQSHYGADNFRVFEASFSLVTTRPEDMSPKQRIPHYDWDDPNYLAIMLHLHHVPRTGTAFYRHVASDLEQVGHESVPELRRLVQAELAAYPPSRVSSEGGSHMHYEELFQVEGCFNRLVIYPGCLLHSAYFSPDFTYSDDPRTGRLTANVFIQLSKGSG